jgi:hypothetical protein
MSGIQLSLVENLLYFPLSRLIWRFSQSFVASKTIFNRLRDSSE